MKPDVAPLELKLAPHERANPVWVRIEKYYQDRLANLREKNDSPNLNEVQTAELRGRIAELRGLLALGRGTTE